MRDWREFIPASYKGMPFQVDGESGTGSRAIPVHEYVRAEFHDTEDMGRKARKWSVTAYVASDVADLEATAVFEVCTSPGPGLLILPWIVPALYRCTEVKRSSEKDAMGKFAFEMSFVEAGGIGSSVAMLFDLRAAGQAAELPALAGNALRSFSR